MTKNFALYARARRSRNTTTESLTTKLLYTRRDRSRGIRDDVKSGEPEVVSRERTWPPQPVAQPSRATGRPLGTKYDNVDQNKAKKEGPGGARGQTGSRNMAATRFFDSATRLPI